jgi:peptide/nickel transport system substrate-binding protein
MHDRAGLRTLRTRERVRTLAAGLVAFALVGTAAACTRAGAENGADAPKTGGTLRVVLSGAMDHLDPQRMYTATEANFSRLTTRTLTTFRSEPGVAASQIVGDLATDTGRPSDNNQVWEFSLKKGAKWEDGAPVTCADLKYGVERSFSKLFAEGAKYPSQYLEPNAQPYEGPFVGGNNNGKGLESIECVDAATVRFHLHQPVGDFGYTVAMPVFAPVPAAKDTKDEYDKHPLSSGPYKIEQNSDRQLVYVRNPFWDRETDSVRKAYPDKIVVTWNPDQPSVTNDLVNSEGEWADAIDVESNVSAPFVQQVINDPALSKRAVSGSTGGVRYFAINMRTVPDLRCRQALEYGINKRKFRAALGGSVFGDFATTMITPQLKAYKDFDLYSSRSSIEGDPDKALDLMKQAAAAGKPCPARLKVAYADTRDYQRVISTVVESYQRIGIEVQRVPIPSKAYLSKTGIGNPANGNDLMLTGWIPDWANGSAVIPPLFDGRLIPKDGSGGNVNFSNLNDDQVNQLIDQALAESQLDRQYILWGELDEKIQGMAATIPLLYIKALRMTGTNVRGGFIHPQFGQPDLCAIGLADPVR